MNHIMNKNASAAYIMDVHGSSALHLAAEFGHTSIVDRLLTFRSLDNSISYRYVSAYTGNQFEVMIS